MGTTLTGTTPQDTYDSLIKVTDNGPLTGSLKVLTDGLGNDSALALSTGAASVTGTLSVSGLTIFNTASADNQTVQVFGNNSSVVVGADKGGGASIKYNSNGNLDITPRSTFSTVFPTGRVGIGVSDPNATLVVKNTAADTRLELDTEVTGTSILSYNRATLAYKEIYLRGSIIQFNPNDVNRVTVTTNGLTFNGDTAAANALDDYEEGTWTMGISFGGGAVDVTTNNNTGTYTKVGRQVTVNGYLQLSNKGSSLGDALITGLPFTVGNSNSNFSAATFWLGQITFVTQIFGLVNTNATTIGLFEINGATGVRTSISNADFANNTDVILSATYFV